MLEEEVVYVFCETWSKLLTEYQGMPWNGQQEKRFTMKFGLIVMSLYEEAKT